MYGTDNMWYFRNVCFWSFLVFWCFVRFGCIFNIVTLMYYLCVLVFWPFFVYFVYFVILGEKGRFFGQKVLKTRLYAEGVFGPRWRPK